MSQLSPEARANLGREAQSRGVDADWLVFAPKVPTKDRHLARLKLADLVLDTRIYNGHTTTSDALKAGVPVITLEGQHFASRVSTRILAAVGLPELITQSLEDYRALAVRLVSERDALSNLGQRLAAMRQDSSRFDTARFPRNLEGAYREMWRNLASDAQPRRITVRAP